MKTRSIFVYALAILLLLSLWVCSHKETISKTVSATAAPMVESKPEAEPVELIIFAAASMTETLTELGNKYTEANKNISILFNFDSSGTLKTQIQDGADVDIFISAVYWGTGLCIHFLYTE